MSYHNSCVVCGRPAAFQCDHENDRGELCCDTTMCDEHRHQVRVIVHANQKGMPGTVDLCPRHARAEGGAA